MPKYITKPSIKANSVRKAVAPKISPVIPPSFRLDNFIIIRTTTDAKKIPSKMLKKGKINTTAIDQIIVANNIFLKEIYSIMVPVFAKFDG